MITYSTVDGWLKRPKVRRTVICFVAAAFVFNVIWTFSLLNKAVEQTDQVIEIAEFWKREALKWRETASRSTLQAAMCLPNATKCDGEKCVNVCTGAPAMEPRP